MIRVVAIVQARLGSTRLPGKVLLPAPGGRPLLQLLVERAGRAMLLDRIVIAKPRGEVFFPQHDRPDWDMKLGWYDGAPGDVLARYQGCATAFGATHIVRLTGDCPLVMPGVIDVLVERLMRDRFEYLRTDPTWPEGLDVEVFTEQALWMAHHLATSDAEREHVTLWMRRNLSHTKQVPNPLHRDLGRLRVTVDEQVDYEVVCDVLRELGPTLTLDQLVALYDAQPALFRNGDIERNEGLHRSLQQEQVHVN